MPAAEIFARVSSLIHRHFFPFGIISHFTPPSILLPGFFSTGTGLGGGGGGLDPRFSSPIENIVILFIVSFPFPAQKRAIDPILSHIFAVFVTVSEIAQ